jgi:hypothetical protein
MAADVLGASVRLPAASVPLPHGSSIEGEVGSSDILNGEIALAPANTSDLSAYASAVSTPGNVAFHRFLSSSTFAQRFGATTPILSATETWLKSSGLSGVSVDPDHLFVHFSGAAGLISSVLGIALDKLKLASGSQGIAPIGNPLVPSDLSSHVKGVLGLDTVERPRDFMVKDPDVPHPMSVAQQPSANQSHALTNSASSSPDASCNGAAALSAAGALSAQQLANLYGFSSLYGQGRVGAGVTVGLVEFEPYSPSDIDTYLACYGVNPQVTNTNVDGGPGNGPGAGEAAMDIEVVAGLAPQSHISVYQGVAAANASDASYLDVYQRIADDDTARVISTSWGECEPEADPALLTSENTIFKQMAVQGQSMFAASGDSGSEACFVSSDAADTGLAVTDPASQPYVTGVGGVTVTPAGAGYEQTTWNNCQARSFASCADGAIGGASGGGLSAEWNRPAWQSLAPAGVNNSREVPDVSASADPHHGDAIVWAGGWIPIAGTSAAAPLWAAATALVDQGCGSPVGFAAPALYARPGATSDVTSGNNDYTDTHNGSYPAGTGYDMATGLGVPSGTSLASALEPIGCPSISGLSVGSGPASGGTVVTISGVNLADASDVMFGANRAAFTVNASASTLTAVTPANGPGSVAVTITTPAGTSAASSAATFAVTSAVPEPVISVVTPNGAPLSGRPQVNVTGSGFMHATAVYVGTASATFTVQSDSSLVMTAPAVPEAEVVDVTVAGPGGTSERSAADLFYYDTFVSLNYVHGYTAASSDGDVYTIGEAPYYGSMLGRHLSAPIVGMATTPGQGGYWLAASDGGIFAFGDAAFYGSVGGEHLNEPIVGMAASSDGRGYWEVASDGGIFAFGDASFHGSTGSIHLNQPIVGMAATPDGQGYWLVASDGGIFSFGDARFFGSTGALHLDRPIESMAAMPDGGGYWLMASDGGIFAFGDAAFYGSAAGRGGIWTTMAVAPPGVGYMLMSATGTGLACGHGIYIIGPGWGAINPTAPLIGMSFYTTASASS